MSPAVTALLLLAGLSEAVGRVLPLVARRSDVSRPALAGLLVTGSVVEGSVFALWPLTSWTLAGLLPGARRDGAALTWTPGLAAPLVIAAVLAFPLLGPLLHLLLLIGVGIGLAGPLAESLIDGAPDLRVLGQVQPYSPLAAPLVERPVWDWLRHRAGLLLFLHNVMRIFVAADHRYRPLHNQAVGGQIAGQLELAGYHPGSGVPVVLLSYSGGAQVATGAVDGLHAPACGPRSS